MIFLMEFIEELVLSPSILSKHLKSHIKKKLIEKVSGRVTDKYGYLICVVNIGKIPNGLIMDTTGDILFLIPYTAAVMKLFVGEICDGVVEEVNQYGLKVIVGPLKVFISKGDFPSKYEFGGNDFYIIGDNRKIEVNSEIRFKIKNMQFSKHGQHPMGTIAEDYLGPL